MFSELTSCCFFNISNFVGILVPSHRYISLTFVPNETVSNVLAKKIKNLKICLNILKTKKFVCAAVKIKNSFFFKYFNNVFLQYVDMYKARAETDFVSFLHKKKNVLETIAVSGSKKKIVYRLRKTNKCLGTYSKRLRDYHTHSNGVRCIMF